LMCRSLTPGIPISTIPVILVHLAISAPSLWPLPMSLEVPYKMWTHLHNLSLPMAKYRGTASGHCYYHPFQIVHPTTHLPLKTLRLPVPVPLAPPTPPTLRQGLSKLAVDGQIPLFRVPRHHWRQRHRPPPRAQIPQPHTPRPPGQYQKRRRSVRVSWIQARLPRTLTREDQSGRVRVRAACARCP
jgi:hypothetical protein